MARLQWLLAGFLGIAMMAGAALWFRAALNEAFERGRESGRAEIRAHVEAEIERRRAASAQALAQSQRDVAALEIERDSLREQFDELMETVRRSAGGDAACLDVDVVRALDRTGRGSGAASRGP